MYLNVPIKVNVNILIKVFLFVLKCSWGQAHAFVCCTMWVVYLFVFTCSQLLGLCLNPELRFLPVCFVCYCFCWRFSNRSLVSSKNLKRSVWISYGLRYQDWLWSHSNPEQQKALTEYHWLNECCIICALCLSSGMSPVCFWASCFWLLACFNI